jgi:immune inhibitor A
MAHLFRLTSAGLTRPGQTRACQVKLLYGVLLCICILLASCSSGATPKAAVKEQATPTVTPTFTPTPLPSPGPENLQNLLATEQLLLMTPQPLANPYSLAQRLKRHSASPIARVGRTAPLNEKVGQEDYFWITNADTHTVSRVRAALVYITAHVYMYVQDGQNVNLAALESSAKFFETKIYPNERAIFGSEWSPGIDDDVHITILNTLGLGTNAGGYFSPEDEYPTSVYPYSNEREMFYISLDGPLPGTQDYNSTLAAELQHLIHWNQRANDPTWLNEGMSVLAQDLNGLPIDGVDASFLQAPDTQLTDWSDDISQDIAHYGASYLFLDYFAIHYGGYGILKELLQDPTAPPENFNHVLAKHGYTDTFYDVLHKWYIANVAQNASIDNGIYGYAGLTDLPALTAQHVFGGYPITESDTVHQYAAEYYQLPAPSRHGAITINLNGDPTVRVIKNAPFDSTNEWWSNSDGNMIDSTLTRSFDLRHVTGKQATLQFAVWYNLEQDSDYAYVEISTDGRNWATLPGQFTTTSNPTGNNFGNGYTGTSGGYSTPQWEQERIDLSRYIGKQIQLRFEVVTGNGVHQQGFAIDDIRIPQIHFQDMLTSENGWISNGFVLSNNVVPEHFFVQALVYQGSQLSITTMSPDLASGQGTLSISDSGTSISQVILIVSAYAAETTLLAHYQLNVTVS